jgi:hypothetical protein
MAFVKIKNFLAKFNFPSPGTNYLEKETVNFLEANFSFVKDNCKVKIKQSTVFISTANPIIKNELFLNQTKILKYLREKFPTHLFTKIHFTHTT